MGAIATKEGINSVKKLLSENQDKIVAALGNAIDPEYFVSVAITCVARTPKLLECTKASLFGALLASAQLRLVPDGVLGHAYLVPYGDKVVFIVGYKGLRELVLRTDKFKDLRARVVYENDRFSFTYGMAEKLEHVPAQGERGEMKAVYAVAEHTSGGANIEVLFKDEIESHRDQYSKSWKKADSAWQTAEDRMWEKTAIRRLAGRLPMSIEVQRAFAQEEKMSAGLNIETGEIIDINPDKKAGTNGGIQSLTEDLEKRNGKNGNSAEPEDDIPIEERTPYEKNKAFVISHLEEQCPESPDSRSKLLRSYVESSKITIQSNTLALIDLPSELKADDLAILAEFIRQEILTPV